MEKPKFLYHGSSLEIKGNLIPKKANDLDEKNLDNSLTGIYASSVRDQAISMAIHSCKGVGQGSLQMEKIKGEFKIKYSIIYRGWPEQKEIYLYTFDSKKFKNRPEGSPQWVSFEEVKPLKIEKLKIKDYIHLIRKANKKERDEWVKEHGYKLIMKGDIIEIFGVRYSVLKILEGFDNLSKENKIVGKHKRFELHQEGDKSFFETHILLVYENKAKLIEIKKENPFPKELRRPKYNTRSITPLDEKLISLKDIKIIFKD